LSGALISNVNGHHAGNVKTAGLGIGAVIEVTRAGEVVPYLKDVISKADIVTIPDHCPCCNAPTSWEGAYLVCTNIKCHDRIKAQLNHFFSIIGTIDLFGPKACDLIVKSGVTRIFDVFQQTEQDFIGMGFGAGQASNLIKELREAKHRPVDDFLVLAAFGLSYLGRGDSKKLLRVCDLENVAHMTSEQILAIPGFGGITSSSIGSALPTISESLSFMCSYLEKIIHTGAKVVVEGSPISGKNIVFTGTMASGSRSEMVKHAESLGAISQSSINKLTNILVAGSKVGDSKIKKAEKLGTIVLSEEAYLVMIA
jgi:DNA ligase (NAD+)